MPIDAPTESPQDPAAQLLERRNRNVGHLLLSERAVPYVTLLAAMLAFRREHELEPLHEDLHAAVRSALGGEAYTAELFNQDLRQLLIWNLITDRLEKERLRGYKDNRRRKFRYRLADEAAAFLLWLEARRHDDLEPADTDTRDLLSELIGTLRETVRLFNKTGVESLDYETARGVFYRLARMGALTDDVSRTLGDFNVRLLGFATSRYDAPTARLILTELDRFLKRFLNRIHTLRTEITPEISKLRQGRLTARWQACLALMQEESRASAHLMRTRLPHPEHALAGLSVFYAADGTLERLCGRVNTAALHVWRKLFTHLRELERRSHRLEDLRARVSEMAALPATVVPAAFLRRLLAPARLVGDMHFWDENEKALPPQPHWERHRVRAETVQWLDAKPRAAEAPVQSLEEARLEALKTWLAQRGLLPAADATRLVSQGAFVAFEDFPRLLELARNGLLGNGARLAKLGFALESTAAPVRVEADRHTLAFLDQRLRLRPAAPQPPPHP
ncbi:MAG: hypothetical protein FJ222_01830 [Lentisphaerae bacterium]|nr:hypothetical protein [Lentisphaerota bacterium]